jgi:UDP-glucuronate decarboxylase|tara:strand:- start:817 stop:1860 length:1044 start_codon:yes stop_codon:yes gene_type:complete
MQNYKKIIKEDADLMMKIDLPWGELKGRNILITGATGFIAGYLIRFLSVLNKAKKLNIRITGTVRNLKVAQKKFKDDDLEILKLIELSILDEIKIKEKYDYIFHMASVASPKLFKDNPKNVVLPNTLGTINLLNFASTMNLKSFIFFSTTGVNGFVDDEIRPISENEYGGLDSTKLENCYLESKRMGENLCIAWHAQDNVPIQIVRPAITYGPGVPLEDGRSYADFINSIVKNKNIVLYSKGKAIRNFCYIADFIIGLFHVIFKGKIGEVYNVSSELEHSIKQAALMLTEDIFKDQNLSVEFDFGSNNDLRPEFNRTTVSTKKVRDLGWESYFSFKAGMKRTVESYL